MSLETDRQDEFGKLEATVCGNMDRFATSLSEHCDSVVIITTISYGGQCELLYYTAGNSFAALESVRRYIKVKDLENTDADAQAFDDENDEDEDSLSHS
jgi:hypothetical protein